MRELASRVLVVGMVALMIASVVAGVAPGVASAAGAVTVDLPDSVTNGDTETGSLIVEGVTDKDGVGSYEVTISPDPSSSGSVSLSASGTHRFEVETSSSGGDLTIGGYTGNTTGSTGTITLADLSIDGESNGDVTLTVSVESLSDTKGNPLTHSAGSGTISVKSGGGSGGPGPGGSTPDEDEDEDTDGGTGGAGGGGGGGGAGPSVPGVDLPEPAEQSSGTIDARGLARTNFTNSTRLSNVDVQFPEGTSGNVTVREFDDVPSGIARPPGRSVAATVDITVPESARNSESTVRMRVRQSRLDELGTTPDQLQIVRYLEESDTWQTLQTSVVSADGDTVVVEGLTPGFSLFSVTTRDGTATATATATPRPGTDTATPEPGTDTATPEPGTDTATPTATESPDAVTSPPVEPGGFDPALIVGVLLVALVAAAIVVLRVRGRI